MLPDNIINDDDGFDDVYEPDIILLNNDNPFTVKEPVIPTEPVN
jgi:hypothetical protein